MLIGNRIFPYPVLNKDKSLSDYNEDCSFSFSFDTDNDGKIFVQKGNLIFKGLHYDLTDTDLNKLIKDGKATGCFIVECSGSTFRKSFPISDEPQDLSIEAGNMNGKVIVSCYVYATENILNYSSKGFQPVYEGYTFDIDKFDILAADDGFSFQVNMDPSEDDKVASIFLVVSKDTDDELMTYSDDGKKITIALPKQYFGSYDNIKRKSDYNNIAFSMIAIPVLAKCISDIQSTEYDSMNDLLEQKVWFGAVLIGYKRVFGTELTFDELDSINALTLAQNVLNNASCKGIKDFGDMLAGNKAGGSEEDE